MKEREKIKEKTKAMFINAACEIMIKNTEAINVRNLGKYTNYNGSAIYTYFDSLEYLKALATIRMLKDYFGDVATNCSVKNIGIDEYLTSWDIYLSHAAVNAKAFQDLYYSKAKFDTQLLLEEYFKLFRTENKELSGSDGIRLIKSGNMYLTEYALLTDILKDKPRDKIGIICNIMTQINYSFLNTVSTLSNSEKQLEKDQILREIEYLLRGI